MTEVLDTQNDAWQHPANLLPPLWLVFLQGTLPFAPWPLPERRTPHPFLPHPWPLWVLALIGIGGLWCIPVRWPHWSLEEPETVPLLARRSDGSEGLSLMASLSPQGLAVLVLFCVLNEEVREAWKLACLSKKGQSEEATRSTQVGEGRAAQGAGLRLYVWDRS